MITNELRELGQKLLTELDTMMPDEIAAKLTAAGIKAHRQMNDTCAVSEYVKTATGVTNISTGLFVVRSMDWDDEDNDNLYDSPSYLMGANLVDFVRRFDAGHYPALVMDDCKPCHSNGVISVAHHAEALANALD